MISASCVLFRWQLTQQLVVVTWRCRIVIAAHFSFPLSSGAPTVCSCVRSAKLRERGGEFRHCSVFRTAGLLSGSKRVIKVLVCCILVFKSSGSRKQRNTLTSRVDLFLLSIPFLLHLLMYHIKIILKSLSKMIPLIKSSLGLRQRHWIIIPLELVIRRETKN